jgi:hypothetical protein
MKKLLTTLSLALLASPFAHAQMSDYLDVFIVKARPEKRADFDAINRKIADANRKAKGDIWIATEVEYGEGNTVQFVSQRQNYAAVESAMTAFFGAIKEAYGPGGVPKMMQDFNNTILSSHSEIRRQRWDLSANAPKDTEELAKLVGGARWIRTRQIRVRPGHESSFEARVKEVKAAFEKDGSNWNFFVAQVVAGAPVNTYYLSNLVPSLAAFDSGPNLQKLMGDEAYADWAKAGGEDVVSHEALLMRMAPELSNPSEEIVKIAPDYWRPKRVAATHVAPKRVETAKAGQ